MSNSKQAAARALAIALGTLTLNPAIAADPAGDYQGQTPAAPQHWNYPSTATAPPPAPGIEESQTTGTGFLGGSSAYAGSNSIATPTGNGAGTGTGIGLGSTSADQPSTQTAIGSPDTPSTTPGGPPTAGTGNGLNQ